MRKYFAANCAVWLMSLFLCASSFAGAKLYKGAMEGRAFKFDKSGLWVTVAPEIGCPLFGFGPSADKNMLFVKAGWAVSYEKLNVRVGNKNANVDLYDLPMLCDYGKSEDGSPVAILKTAVQKFDREITVTRRIFFSNTFNKIVVEVDIACTDFVRCNYLFQSFWNMPETIAAGNGDIVEVDKFRSARLRIGQQVKLNYEKLPMVKIMGESGVTLGVVNRKYAVGVQVQSLPISLKPEQTFTMRWVMSLGDVDILQDNKPVLSTVVRKNIVKAKAAKDFSGKPPAVGVGGGGSKDFPLLWSAAGLKFLRTDSMSWSVCQPDAAAAIDFETQEKQVELYKTFGMGTWAVLGNVPDWAKLAPASECSAINLNKYGEYVSALAGAFKGKILAYEIGFTPAVENIFTDNLEGSIKRYLKILRQAYESAKSADSDCVVISAGIGGPGEAFLVDILKGDAAQWCDGIGFAGGGESTAMVRRRLRIVANILRYFKVNKKVWITSLACRGGENPFDDIGVNSSLTIPAVTWCVGRANNPYSLVKPVGEKGFVLNPAYNVMRKICRAGVKPKLRMKLPEEIKLKAGESKKIKIRRSRYSKKVQPFIRVEGLHPSWYKANVKMLSSGRIGRISFELNIPKFVKPGKYEFVIGVADQTVGLLGSVFGTLEIDNVDENSEDGEAAYIDIDVVQRPSAFRDENGKSDGVYGPAGQWNLQPGYLLRQPMEVMNVGTEDEEFEISVEGHLAKWCKLSRDTVKLDAGGKRYVMLEVFIPKDAVMGPKSVDFVVRSKRVESIFKRKIIHFKLANEPEDKKKKIRSK